MPKYSFMISKAVDLVARKLAGLDSETVSRLTQVLSEEAQMISEELQHSGQNVDSDILAARLDGVVARMKYEVRNQGPDPSPHEFPIFNVSHNPSAPYPNPINHLYDKRYKEAYSTFIKQNQPPPTTLPSNEPPTPTSPAASTPAKPTVNPNPAYYQGQQPPQPGGVLPPFRQQPSSAGGQYVNPYATMPRSQAAYYQQQAARLPQPGQGQLANNQTTSVRRSSTREDLPPNSLSHSASSNDLIYSTNPSAEKIRVRVINDKPATTTAIPYKQRSILKSNNDQNNTQETGRTRTIYASPNTAIGPETMEDLFKVVDNQRSATPSSPMTERVIIIDRRGPNASDNNNPNSAAQDRFRTFEIRSSTPGTAPTTSPSATNLPAAVSTATPTTNAPSPRYVAQQPNYYPGQQVYYQQPKMYMPTPSNPYSAVVPYAAGANNYYPFVFYPY